MNIGNLSAYEVIIQLIIIMVKLRQLVVQLQKDIVLEVHHRLIDGL